MNLCLDGSVKCDPILLQPREVEAVQEAVRRRNLDLCLSGSAKCDPLLLTKQEATEASAAAQSAPRQRSIALLAILSSDVGASGSVNDRDRPSPLLPADPFAVVAFVSMIT